MNVSKPHARPLNCRHELLLHLRSRHCLLRAASNESVVCQHGSAAYQALCETIRASGGYVHPSLQLNPVKGGIIAAQDIPQPKGSLVELPLNLRLTSAVAQELLLPALNAAGLPTMSLLEESQQLALAVAWLRNQPQKPEAMITWQPYVHTMPQEIPCGWAKTPQQLSADYDTYLYQHGLDVLWWQYFVAQVQQQMHEQAAQLTARFGKALGLNAADVLWALGQVQARKVVIDNEVLLEPWSDLLRHPPSPPSGSSPSTSEGSSSRCEIQWTYGLCRTATSVVSRGAGKRVTYKQAHRSTTTGTASTQPMSDRETAAAAASEKDGPQLLLSAGEELWASSSSSSNVGGDLFSGFVQEQGHLAPLAWYLQHGNVPEGLAHVNMRTSDVLESWRRTVAYEAGGHSSTSASTASTAAEQGSSKSSSKPTVLWDYLTQQYQQDALTVLAATPAEHQQQLLHFLMQPVTQDTAPAATLAAVSEAAVDGAIVSDVDPLLMIGALDNMLIAAIDAAEEAEQEQQAS